MVRQVHHERVSRDFAIVLYCHCEERTPHLSLREAQRRGNLVAVAMVVCQRVFNLNEIATLRSQ